MKNTTFIVIFLSLFIVLGNGCTKNENTKINQNNIQVSQVSSFRSTPPWSYPVGTKDEDKINSMRSQLAGFFKESKDEDVMAYIFFQRVLSFEEMSSWIKKYNLVSGGKSSIVAKLDDGGIAGETFPAGLVSGVDIETYIKNKETPIEGYSFWEKPLGISSVSLYGKVESFVNIWEENKDIVRGIGLLGRKGEEVTNWYPIDVGAPIR